MPSKNDAVLLWKTADVPHALTAISVATAFIAENYPDRRLGLFSGKWEGGTFRGTFMLHDGFRVYRLICDASKTWKVTSIPEPELAVMGDPENWL